MIINKKKIFDILQSEEVSPLESDVEIEDFILVIKDIDSKISFLEKLKKERTRAVSEEMEKLLSKKDKFKEVISKTLEAFDHKALNFPGVGRVTIKTTSGKWTVLDEEALIEVLKEKLSDEAFSEVVVQKQVIVKKALNAVLDSLSSLDTISNIVDREKEDTSLMITFDKKSSNKIEAFDYDETSEDLDNYDGLDNKEVDI